MVNIGKTKPKAKGKRKTKAKARGKARGKVVAKAKDIKQMFVPSFMPSGGQSSVSHMMPDGSRMPGISHPATGFTASSHPIAEPRGKPQSLEQSLFNNTMPRTIPLISQLGYPSLTNNYQPQSSSTRDRIAYQDFLTKQPTIDIAGSKPTSNIATDIFSGNANPPETLDETGDFPIQSDIKKRVFPSKAEFDLAASEEGGKQYGIYKKDGGDDNQVVIKFSPEQLAKNKEIEKEIDNKIKRITIKKK